MDSNALLSTLFLLVIPLTGLLLGAVLPPFHYTKNTGLAAGSNVIGFILYMLPFLLTASALAFFGERREHDLAVMVLFGTATFFFAVEALIFFLLWLRKRLRDAHSPSNPQA